MQMRLGTWSSRRTVCSFWPGTTRIWISPLLGPASPLRSFKLFYPAQTLWCQMSILFFRLWRAGSQRRATQQVWRARLTCWVAFVSPWSLLRNCMNYSPSLLSTAFTRMCIMKTYSKHSNLIFCSLAVVFLTQSSTKRTIVTILGSTSLSHGALILTLQG